MSVGLTDGEVREEDLLKVSRSISQQNDTSKSLLFICSSATSTSSDAWENISQDLFDICFSNLMSKHFVSLTGWV